MPEKSSSVISYAAGASLAAVALIYVFGPNFTLDHDSVSSRKKTIVGLRNQANDCFINSVLQALAGLEELRRYLTRETHRRHIDDPRVYAHLVQPDGTDGHGHGHGNGENALPLWKLQGLQDGLVSHGLKQMLDALNERPLARKAISPFPFVRVLEAAFKQRISRQQQDAQEFLQIVAERLKDEYHAGQRARSHARVATAMAMALDASTGSGTLGSGGGRNTNNTSDDDDEKRALALAEDELGGSYAEVSAASILLTERAEGPGGKKEEEEEEEEEEGFPLEGKYESNIKCQSCGYTTKPREETFCSLTLAVPQVASTSLNACFDGIFKTEYIDDFKCDMCRLLQAKTRLERELERIAGPDSSEGHRAILAETIEKLRWAIEHDPEHAPEGVELGDTRHAPRTRIAKTTRMVTFPKILAVHLSRSIYDIGRTTQKNSASVAFPEQLPLGGLMQQRKYKLLGLVTHRGGHNSGHYEAFRRQNAPAPYANSNTFQPSGVYSKTPTPVSTPEISARRSASPAISTPDLLSAGSASASSSSSNSPSLSSMSPRRPRLRQKKSPDPPTSPRDGDRDGETSSLRSVALSTKSALFKLASGGRSEKKKHGSHGNGSATSSPSPSPPPVAKYGRKKKQRPGADKWWRVSDEKVKEAKTSEVLGMQKEVYLLFYELEKDAHTL